jgi:hypothetical protein
VSGIKAKHQRLVLLVIALVALVGAGLLAAYALRNQAAISTCRAIWSPIRPNRAAPCAWAAWWRRDRSRPGPMA